MLVVLCNTGCEPTTKLFTALRREDEQRNAHSKRKIQNETRNRRQRLRRDRKTKRKEEPVACMSGSFGLAAEPEKLVVKEAPPEVLSIDENDDFFYKSGNYIFYYFTRK